MEHVDETHLYRVLSIMFINVPTPWLRHNAQIVLETSHWRLLRMALSVHACVAAF